MGTVQHVAPPRHTQNWPLIASQTEYGGGAVPFAGEARTGQLGMGAVQYSMWHHCATRRFTLESCHARC